MPGRGTPKYGVRMPPDLWARFGEAVAAAGTDRTAAIRAMVEWYVRDRPKPPPRP